MKHVTWQRRLVPEVTLAMPIRHAVIGAVIANADGWSLAQAIMRRPAQSDRMTSFRRDEGRAAIAP